MKKLTINNFGSIEGSTVGEYAVISTYEEPNSVQCYLMLLVGPTSTEIAVTIYQQMNNGSVPIRLQHFTNGELDKETMEDVAVVQIMDRTGIRYIVNDFIEYCRLEGICR
jgi:hypothetical protein